MKEYLKIFLKEKETLYKLKIEQKLYGKYHRNSSPKEEAKKRKRSRISNDAIRRTSGGQKKKRKV